MSLKELIEKEMERLYSSTILLMCNHDMKEKLEQLEELKERNIILYENNCVEENNVVIIKDPMLKRNILYMLNKDKIFN